MAADTALAWGAMMWSQENSRALSRVLLTALAGIVLSWLGLVALVVLSILWPANQVPHVLLGVWLCAIFAVFAWPGRRPWRNQSLLMQILLAPLSPVIVGGGEIRKALGR